MEIVSNTKNFPSTLADCNQLKSDIWAINYTAASNVNEEDLRDALGDWCSFPAKIELSF